MFDQELADSYVGKTILIGMTYTYNDGTFIENKQLFGTIIRINETEGIVIMLQTQEEFKLPPELRCLQEAPKGKYRLRSTGQVIINPDLFCTWTLTKAPSA